MNTAPKLKVYSCGLYKDVMKRSNDNLDKKIFFLGCLLRRNHGIDQMKSRRLKIGRTTYMFLSLKSFRPRLS